MSNHQLPPDDILDGADIGSITLRHHDETPRRIDINAAIGRQPTIAAINKEIIRRRLSGTLPVFTTIEYFCLASDHENSPDLIWVYDMQALQDTRCIRASASYSYRLADEWVLD